MVKDHLSDKTDGDKIIEILILSGDNPEIGVWMPVIATQLYITDKNGDIRKVSELRVRDLSLERSYEEKSRQVDVLTRWLKDNSQEDREYGNKWNERANLKLEMSKLLEEINS